MTNFEFYKATGMKVEDFFNDMQKWTTKEMDVLFEDSTITRELAYVHGIYDFIRHLGLEEQFIEWSIDCSTTSVDKDSEDVSDIDLDEGILLAGMTDEETDEYIRKQMEKDAEEDWSDLYDTSDMAPCDYSGVCGGPSCSCYARCHGWVH